MTVKVRKKAVAAEVTVDKKITQENLGDVTVVENPANVGFSMNYTMNLGDFQSVKMGVSLYMPVTVARLEEDGDIEPALTRRFDFVKGWVEARMEALVKEVETSRASDDED